MLNLFINILLFLIQTVEKFEYRCLELDQNDIGKKILNSFDLQGYEVMTDTGFKPISHLHITQPYTNWHIVTSSGLYLNAADNHIVFKKGFQETFISDLKVGDFIHTINGLESVDSIVKQNYSLSMFDVTVDDENHRFYSNGILSHNTICSAIFIAWYLLFNFDKNALILSNKGGTTKEILDKAKAIIENLPFFLKPGILKNDVMNMKFDNGCRIVGQSTTGKAGIGFTIHLLFLDEFAHIHHSFINSFYENVYPTLSSSKVSRIIITSTPNGYNKFFEIYDAADRGVNEFAPFRVDWWQVPGRDEKWKEQEVKNLGSEEAFNRQYGNQFMASSNLLLSGASIKKLKTGQKKFEHVDFEELEKISIDTSRCLFVSPEYENEDFKDRNRYWLFCVDLAEGIGGDYSVINIFEILPMAKKDFNRVLTPSSVNDFFAIKQAIVFRSNEHSIEDISKVLYTFCVDIFYQENVKVVIEYNTYGATVINHMATIFPQRNEFDEEMVVKFKHRHDAANTKFGLKIKKDNKPIFCQNLKKYVEQNKMIITDEITIKELSSFGRTITGTYVGQMGHDDHVMTCVSATEFFATLDFSDFVEELLDIIDEDLYETMEAELEKTTKDKDGNVYYDIYDIIH
jgi:regulator of RNase E activity RraB